jgi:hypothetical protein
LPWKHSEINEETKKSWMNEKKPKEIFIPSFDFHLNIYENKNGQTKTNKNHTSRYKKLPKDLDEDNDKFLL